MLARKGGNAGLLVRHMRRLSQPVEECEDSRSCLEVATRTLSLSSNSGQQAKPRAEDETTNHGSVEGHVASRNGQTKLFPFGTFYNGSGQGQDLQRFLEEVGTDPKEARFWLKHFKRSSESFNRPFAIVQVDTTIFKEPTTKAPAFNQLQSGPLDQQTIKECCPELDKLASTLAFLHRNNMKCVVVHGEQLKNLRRPLSAEQLRHMRTETTRQSMLLASILEMHGAHARPLFPGSNILQATPQSESNLVGDIVALNLGPVRWAIESDHIPIIQGIGESLGGQMLALDVHMATKQLSLKLQPRKVLFINMSGGLVNECNEVIPNISIPCTDEFLNQSWCTSEVRQQIEFVTSLLYCLPKQSSVVVTEANKLLAELFTHHGSGTFFKMTEPIQQHHSLSSVDVGRLTTLFNKSFGRELVTKYIERLGDRFHTLYLSEDYNAAAIVTHEPEAGVPYLDKFTVSVAKQSEGTADVLWQMIRKDFKKLCWRSRRSNPINPWYFKRCAGSWSNGKWIVFWYGAITHTESLSIVNHTLSLPNSFTK